MVSAGDQHQPVIPPGVLGTADTTDLEIRAVCTPCPPAMAVALHTPGNVAPWARQVPFCQGRLWSTGQLGAWESMGSQPFQAAEEKGGQLANPRAHTPSGTPPALQPNIPLHRQTPRPPGSSLVLLWALTSAPPLLSCTLSLSDWRSMPLL